MAFEHFAKSTKEVIEIIQRTRVSKESVMSKADIKEGTTVVIIMSTIVAIFLALVDAGFGFFIRTLLLKG